MPLYNLVSFHSPDERDGTTSTLNRDHLKHLGSFHHRFEKRSHRCSLARPMKSPRSLVSIEEASRVAFHERHSRSSAKNPGVLRDSVFPCTNLSIGQDQNIIDETELQDQLRTRETVQTVCKKEQPKWVPKDQTIYVP